MFTGGSGGYTEGARVADFVGALKRDATTQGILYEVQQMVSDRKILFNIFFFENDQD